MGSFVSGSETDYQARYEFLAGTTELMHPAPIDTLLDLLPVFRSWWAQLREYDDTGALTAIIAAGRTIPEFDHSPEAPGLRTAIAGWMSQHLFSDAWIADAAVCTLFVHAGAAGGRPAHRGWYITPPWTAMNPSASDGPLPRRGNESIDDYLARFNRHFRHIDRWRHGQNAHQHGPARWTVLRHLLGKTFRQIADVESQYSDDAYSEDKIRKAVAAFVRRAGITPSKNKIKPSV